MADETPREEMVMADAPPPPEPPDDLVPAMVRIELTLRHSSFLAGE